jgi:hypothetical protein
MSKRYLVVSILAAILAIPASAQTPADLFQKAIHAQETTGDLDGAIRIFRQVAAETRNRPLAAQAQYQLVLCMLQKGDRPGASKELDALARNFPEQPDLFASARKLIPGSAALLPAPWGEGEYSQLNIKRDGTFTGETLYHSIEPYYAGPAAFNNPSAVNSQGQAFRWELKTNKTTRSVWFNADRSTMQLLGQANLSTNDALGDSGAAALSGPAIDVEQSVFLMRRLPLAPGFKTTLTSMPFTVGQTTAKEIALTVTGIEAVQVTAGKFNCFKVSFSGIGQTFWIGVDRGRPLVKFQNGNVEAELMKVWGPENLLDSALAGLPAGWKVKPAPNWYPGATRNTSIDQETPRASANLSITKIYTPPAEIAQTLRKDVQASLDDTLHVVRAGSIQERLIAGRQALSWWVDGIEDHGVRGTGPIYYVAVRSESVFVQVYAYGSALTRWYLDPAIETIRVP